ncbi:Kelch repeat-containing protein [[Eubacterium] cellulosolvens]
MVGSDDKTILKVWSIFIIIILICSAGYVILLSSTQITSVSAASTWSETSEKDFNNGTLDNTTIEGTGNNAEVMLDMSDLNHWTEKFPTTKPTARRDHAMAEVWGTDKVLLFGGYTTSTMSDETWIYEFGNNTWKNMNPPNKPSARYAHAMASIWGTDKVLLYGAWFGNDTWLYDLSDNNWTQLFIGGPSPRRYFAISSIYGTDKVVFFGGWWDCDDTWIFDLSGNSWTNMNPQNKPPGRGYHAMASIYGSDNVILFGGYITSGITDDTWIYDLSQNNWTQKYPTTRPARNYYHKMASIWGTDNVLMFSGLYSGTTKEDTWLYDFSLDTWIQKIPRNAANEPSRRYMHGLASVYSKDSVVLFGGLAGSTGTASDTWIYKQYLKTKNGTYTSKPFDTKTNSSFDTLSWSDEIPDNTNIKLQLRTTDTKLELNSTKFVGPDGKPGTFYTASPSNIWSGHHGDRWIQYIVYFNISIVTDSPTLKDVMITYNCLPRTIVIGPFNGSLLSTNKPVFKWTFEDLDSSYQQTFQVVISKNITFETIEYDSGEQNTEEQTWVFPTGTSYTTLPDGGWYWMVRTQDGDGAWTEYSKPWEFRIDTNPPNSAPAIPINNGYYQTLPTISGIANDGEVGSGLTKVEISIKRLSDNYYWDGGSWIPLTTWLEVKGTYNWIFDSRDIEWTSGNRYSVQSRAIDNASNVEVPGINNIFTIDTENPESMIDNPINNVWINKLNIITGTAVDIGGSGVDKVEICIKCAKDSVQWDAFAKENEYWDGNDWTSSETWLTASGTNDWSFNTSNIPWSTGDHYLIQSRAVDKTTNTELPSPGTTFMYDAKPPNPISIYINNGEEFTGSKLVSLSLNAIDLGSGVSKMAFSTDGMVWSAWELFNNTRPFDLQSGDGEKTIYFRAQDYTGNIAEPVTDNIILDTTPPHELAININDGEEITGSKQIRLDFHASDLGSGVSEMTYSFDGYNWRNWESFKNTKFVLLPPGDGERVIFYKARDKVGNVAEPVSDSIKLDTAPPYSLSIEINHGAGETNSTTVTLDLNALDDVSGVSEFAFSLDGETWSDWEPFASERAFTLPPTNGEQTVYFKVKDKVGNEAKPVYSIIIMNITTPEKELKTIKTESGNDFWNYIMLVIVVLVIMVLIIVAMAMVIRKKKHTEQQLPAAQALTIKPQGYIRPMVAVEQVGRAPGAGYVQIPSTTGAPIPSHQVPIPVPTPVPILAKTTQPQPTPPTTGQPTVVPQPVPQLPPAKVQPAETQTATTTSTPTPTLAIPEPQPTITPQPTLAEPKPTQPLSKTTPTPTVAQPTSTPQPQPTIAQSPTITQSPATTNGPVIHLPDSESRQPASPLSNARTPTVIDGTKKPNSKMIENN